MGETEPVVNGSQQLVVVTGCAGFIGSHTTERLLAAGHSVRGVDCFTDNYDPELKRRNLLGFSAHPNFELLEDDLLTTDPTTLLDGVDSVLHLAGQPGVRTSWADGFGTYVERNIQATQRLLEAAKQTGLQRFVAASSSSIYGDAEAYPTTESAVPKPVSPYGVTKLAAEHLCTVYASNFRVPTVSLRYFTVYGPRQRPDMALRRMIEAALHERPFPLFGDGSVSRSFTYIDDVVQANLGALFHQAPAGTVCNIANESTCSMMELIALVGEILGHEVLVDRRPGAAGDAKRTGGSSRHARDVLDWEPATSLVDGVRAQVAWQQENPLPSDHPDLIA